MLLDNLVTGFATALSLHNLMYAFIGVFLGNIVGVLPGIGALAAISMLLPVTYGLDPTGSLVMLAGMYYGTSFGGATTSILLNLPGTSAHAVVCLDGHPLAQQGRGGPAIFIAMFASFIGVSVGIVLMTLFSPLLVDIAFSFGAAEYFSLMLMGLIAASALTTGSPIMGIGSVLIGLVLGVVGTDINTGIPRFDFGVTELQDGISLVVLAMGLFGLTDVIANAGILKRSATLGGGKLGKTAVRPGPGEIRASAGPIARGSVVGSLLGALPGTGSTVASFISYAVEKKSSRTPERFGAGAMEGVAGPEAANSSADITAFIPTLTLGIPGSATMALMLGALMIHDISPGPQLIAEHPSLFWGLIASFWLGNVMLLILNIPLVGVWVKLLSVPYRLIYPIVLFLIALGVYSTNNNLFDVGAVLAVGVFGYLVALLGFQPAPMLLSFVLGPMVEENFRRALLVSRGDALVFFTSPLSGSFMAVIALMLIGVTYKRFKRRRSTENGG